MSAAVCSYENGEHSFPNVKSSMVFLSEDVINGLFYTNLTNMKLHTSVEPEVHYLKG